MPYVRLGNSGLKISRLVLYVLTVDLFDNEFDGVGTLGRGCMSYGNTGFGDWILGEEEGEGPFSPTIDGQC